MYPAYSVNTAMEAHQFAVTDIAEIGMRRPGAGVLWGLRHSLPTTEQLLVSGGDARIALTHNSLANSLGSGLANQYGCPPTPDPALFALGSSTASVISVAGHAAAERLRSRLLLAIQMEPAARVYARELARQRVELATLCGVDSMPGLDIAIGASGTDLHLIAAQYCASQTQAPLLTITVNASETGSGVPAALAAARADTTVSVALRLPDGSLRPSVDVDAVIEDLTVAAVAAGKRVLLVAVDVSKSGLIAPSVAAIVALKRRFADSLDVLIDACQFRLAPATLRAYLDLGCMVALTGSKFVTGPAFSGALLLPAGLRGSTQCVDSPVAWRVSVDDNVNFGLLLRWEAALHELREFRAVPEAQATAFLTCFAAAVGERLAGDALFEVLPVAPLDRAALAVAGAWDAIQTIFSFVPHHPETRGGGALSVDETSRLYHALFHAQFHAQFHTEGASELRCQFGQPVACGHRQGSPISALRLCASARLVVEATSGDNAIGVINRTLAALGKTAALLRSGAY